MLRRLLYRPLRLRLQTLTLLSSPSSSSPLPPPPRPHPRLPFSGRDPTRSFLLRSLRFYSASRGDGGDDDDGIWKLSPESDEVDSVFGEIAEGGEEAFGSEAAEGAFGSEAAEDAVKGFTRGSGDPWAEDAVKGFTRGSGDPWAEGAAADSKGDVFEGIDREVASKEGGGGVGEEEWGTVEGYKPWTFGEDEETGDVFGAEEIGEGGIEGIDGGEVEEAEKDITEEKQKLEEREKELLETLKGPNRAFGDLIAASGITEDMIDSLILLKDVRNVPGLPPLREIEDKAIARLNATSSRAEIERKKQEEIAQARVRQVDEKGRSYGTGRRKCSVARVWIQPGDGKFVVNDKQFDAYFPILDQRAELLRPFTVTKTLGLWDVNCTVKGGGVSGQVGAVRLGISRALQNWEPGLRPYLKAAGYLTRDARVVERKKPGKAKARKSFQWVKR